MSLTSRQNRNWGMFRSYRMWKWPWEENANPKELRGGQTESADLLCTGPLVVISSISLMYVYFYATFGSFVLIDPFFLLIAGSWFARTLHPITLLTLRHECLVFKFTSYRTRVGINFWWQILVPPYWSGSWDESGWDSFHWYTGTQMWEISRCLLAARWLVYHLHEEVVVEIMQKWSVIPQPFHCQRPLEWPSDFLLKVFSWKSVLYASNWVSIHVHCYTMLAKHIY